MKNDAGFTLTELAVTVAIIGVLSSIAVPSYQRYVAQGQAHEAFSEMDKAKDPIIQNILKNNKCTIDGKPQNIQATYGVLTVSGTPTEVSTLNTKALQPTGCKFTYKLEKNTNSQISNKLIVADFFNNGALSKANATTVDAKYLPQSFISLTPDTVSQIGIPGNPIVIKPVEGGKDTPITPPTQGNNKPTPDPQKPKPDNTKPAENADKTKEPNKDQENSTTTEKYALPEPVKRSINQCINKVCAVQIFYDETFETGTMGNFVTDIVLNSGHVVKQQNYVLKNNVPAINNYWNTSRFSNRFVRAAIIFSNGEVFYHYIPIALQDLAIKDEPYKVYFGSGVKYFNNQYIKDIEVGKNAPFTSYRSYEESKPNYPKITVDNKILNKSQDIWNRLISEYSEKRLPSFMSTSPYLWVNTSDSRTAHSTPYKYVMNTDFMKSYLTKARVDSLQEYQSIQKDVPNSTFFQSQAVLTDKSFEDFVKTDVISLARNIQLHYTAMRGSYLYKKAPIQNEFNNVPAIPYSSLKVVNDVPLDAPTSYSSAFLRY